MIHVFNKDEVITAEQDGKLFVFTGRWAKMHAFVFPRLIQKLDQIGIEYELDLSDNFNFVRFHELGVTVHIDLTGGMNAAYYDDKGEYVDKEYDMESLTAFLKLRAKKSS